MSFVLSNELHFGDSVGKGFGEDFHLTNIFLMGQMQHPVNHESSSTWYHVGHHLDFLTIQISLVL